MVAMVHIEPGFIIDHTNIVDTKEIIGYGTWGEVSKAFWGIEDLVAIKKLYLEGAQPELISRLEKEINILLTVQHPKILRYYGVCLVSDSELWIVMEYADGGNLQNVLHTMHLDWNAKWFVALEVARAVAYLHSKGIVHRAIKPFNFLMVNGELKVSDFGMSTAQRIYASTPAGKVALGKRSAIGRWLAPESTRGAPVFNTNSDVYALGMVLWGICAEDIPFPELKDDGEVLQKMRMENRRPDFPIECNGALKELIMKCWVSQEVPKKPANHPAHPPPERPSIQDIMNIVTAYAPNGRVVLSSNRQSVTNKKHFEVSYEELVKHTGTTAVRTLTSPPPFPGDGVGPHLPPSINLVTLFPPPVSVPLNKIISVDYHHRVFRRVQEYFHSFYVPSDPNLEVSLDKVEVLFNPYLESRYAKLDDLFAKKFAGMTELRYDELTDPVERQYLENLLVSKNLVCDRNSNPISAWHGASSKHLESICWYGLMNLGTTDAGYYGKGIYLTQKGKYGEYYINSTCEKAEGKFSLLLCWALLGCPKAITKVQYDTNPPVGFTSGYVVVAKKQAESRFFQKAEDAANFENLFTYFPVGLDEPGQGDEIVVYQPEQILPKYIVHYNVHKKGEIPSGHEPREPVKAPIKI